MTRSWTRRQGKTAVRRARIFWSRRFPVLLALWLGLIFAERLVVDRWIYVYGDGQHLRECLEDIAVWTYFFFGCGSLSLAYLLSKESAERSGGWLHRFVGWIRGELRDVRFYAVLLLIAFFQHVFRHLGDRLSFAGAIMGFLKESGQFRFWSETLGEIGYLMIALVAALASFSTLQWVGRFLEARVLRQSLKEAFTEWRLSNGFLTANLAVYFIIYWLAIGRGLQGTAYWATFVTGFLKDAAIYHLMALGVVNTMYRWERCVDDMEWAGRWHFLGVFWGGTVAIAVLALALDLHYIDGIGDPMSKISLDYPHAAQRQIILVHTYIRDFVLMIPLLAVMMVRSVGRALERRPEEGTVRVVASRQAE